MFKQMVLFLFILLLSNNAFASDLGVLPSDTLSALQSNTALNLEADEITYIENSPIIEVAIYPAIKPLQYFDNKNEFRGITADIFKLISKNTGLKFNFTKFDSFSQYTEALKRGNYTMVSSKSQYFDPALSEYIVQTQPYRSTYTVVAKNTTTVADPSHPPIMTAVHGTNYVRFNEQLSCIYFDSFEECLSAVNSGKADYTVESSDVMNYWMQAQSYNNLTVSPLAYSDYNLCLGLTKPVDEKLLTIINKAIDSITTMQIDEIIKNNASIRLSLIEYFRQNVWTGLIFIFFIFGTLMMLLMIIVKNQLNHAKSLYKLSNIDSLTGASNSIKFKSDTQKTLLNNTPQALIALDIKKFSIINDIYGHARGDILLKEITEILNKSISNTEHFARINADIFYILKTFTNEKSITDFIQLIQENISCLIEGYFIEISFGIYVIPDGLNDVDIICDRATLAVRAAKNNIYHNFFFFNDELRNAILAEQEIANLADDALAANEFMLYLQPQHRFKDGKLLGAEALTRWHSSIRGKIYPDEFIPLFEKNGFIRKLDKYMFTTVCRYLQNIQQKYPDIPLPVISVNFSRLHFNNLNLAKELLDILKYYNVPPSALEIELTESAVYYNEEHFIKIIQTLKSAGFRLALDDFGTGYSSLNTLKDLPVDTIKLDKGFLDKSTDTPRGQNIIKCLIILAKAVDLTTVVEGVETREQADFLTDIGCDVAQGYYYAKPMPGSEFLNYWNENNK